MIKISQNTKQLVFALVITLALALIVDVNNGNNESSLLPAITLSSFILVIQVYIIYRRASSKLKQLQIPTVDRYKSSVEILYHFILPLVFFLDLCMFVYFNTVYLLTPLLLVFCFVVFLVLFINIRAYFEDKFKIELSTHFIYFFIINFTLFSFSIAILSISYSENLPIILTSGLVAIVGGLMFYLNHIEDAFINLKLLLGVLSFGVLAFFVSLFLFQEYNSILRTSFILSACFYFTNALLIHKKEGTLDWIVVLEYLTVLALGFTVLFGINQ